MTADQTASVEWRDGGTPVSTRYDDPYFSLEDGYAESMHVFLAGNGLPARFRPDFCVAELGFGTGLNLLSTAIALQQAGLSDPVRFTSFEAFPLSPKDIRAALDRFPIPDDLLHSFLAAWNQGKRTFDLPGVSVSIIEGDVRQTLPRWQGRADAWFLDGFSPAKNPEMWEPALMAEVARHTAPGGTFATYTAAGHVRQSLAAAGFEVERVSGHGRKRHMTIGRFAAPA